MKVKEKIPVGGYQRERLGKIENVSPHWRYAFVDKQGKVVGFAKDEGVFKKGLRFQRITPSKAFKRGLGELQRSKSWKKSEF